MCEMRVFVLHIFYYIFFSVSFITHQTIQRNTNLKTEDERTTHEELQSRSKEFYLENFISFVWPVRNLFFLFKFETLIAYLHSVLFSELQSYGPAISIAENSYSKPLLTKQKTR